jgi:hypothetical protein
MRIGLDIDGLPDERPDFFSFLSHSLRTAGHFVAVLTYRDPDSRTRTEGQLAAWGISYDELLFAKPPLNAGQAAPTRNISEKIERPGLHTGL